MATPCAWPSRWPEAGAAATLLPIDAEGNLPEGGWDTLAAADAIVLGSLTYMWAA
jgi:hypothetical protein